MSTSAPRRRKFDAFLAEQLQDETTRASFHDTQTRSRVVDMLVRLRNRRGMTQTAVAKEMGVKQPTVSGFETEGSDPRLSTLLRYARAVDATLWVSVVPNASRRRDMYVPEGSYEVHRKTPSRRAEEWAFGPSTRYRHLHAVPDQEAVPA